MIESDLAKIRSWGFNSINIPLFSEAFSPSWDLVDESYFDDVLDTALGSAERHGLYVVLDLHQYRLSSFFNKVDRWASGLPPWLFEGYENSLDGFNQAWYDIIWNRRLRKGYDPWSFLGYVWEYIAGRYNRRNVVLGMSLLNEPHLPKGTDEVDFNGRLLSLHEYLIDRVRKRDSIHTLMLGTGDARCDRGLIRPSRPNLMLDAHEYYPVRPWWLRWCRWINPNRDVNCYRDLARSRGVEVLFSEFGSLPNDEKTILQVADSIISRERDAAQMRGWIYWAYNCEEPIALARNPHMVSELRKRLKPDLHYYQ